MKRNYWPLFFIGIFSFVFGMIIWTIVSTTSVPIHPDKSFLKSYQEVDENYNTIMESNIKFIKKYNFSMKINDKEIPLSTEDIKYSQRVLEKISTNKNLLNVGQNNIKLLIIDKEKNIKMPVDIALIITKSYADDKDKIFNTSSFINNDEEYSSNFNIEEENNWNITGTFQVNDDIGYIFIKTNAI